MKTQTKIKPLIPGLKPENVVSNAYVIPMVAGLAVIHPNSHGKGYHAEFYEGTGSSVGTCVDSLKEAGKQVKRYSREYHALRSKRGTIRELMRQLANQL